MMGTTKVSRDEVVRHCGCRVWVWAVGRLGDCDGVLVAQRVVLFFLAVRVTAGLHDDFDDEEEEDDAPRSRGRSRGGGGDDEDGEGDDGDDGWEDLDLDLLGDEGMDVIEGRAGRLRGVDF